MEFKGTKGQIYAVEYAGIIFMQDTEFYEDQEQCNVLNMDYVSKEVAEANGKLFECAKELLERLVELNAFCTMNKKDREQNEALIKKATTI